MLTEAQGTAVLRRVFTAAGYDIVDRVDFEEGEVKVNLDGWDEKARVGYEYLTEEEHDDREFTAKVVAELEARLEKGELHVLLIDEHDIETEEELESAAKAFLDRVAEAKAS